MASGTEYNREDVNPSLIATRQAGMDFASSEEREEREKAENKLKPIHVAQTSVNVQPVQGLPSFKQNGTGDLKLVTANVNIQDKEGEEASSQNDILKLVGVAVILWIITKLIR